MASQAEQRRLCFVSWNTNGIKGKIPKVFNSLSDLKADIVFLQETHVGPKCCQIFKSIEKNWNVFFTVYSPKSKGVAILINKEISFEYICHDEDCSGGYIVLFCYLYGELYTLVNVYNHKADRIVLEKLKVYLSETAEGVLVVGGDFNTVLDPSLDREPPTSQHSPFRAILEDFTVSLKLKDVWSYLHPLEQDRMHFTRYQNESYSRIDMFFMVEDQVNRVCHIMPNKQDISDHYALVLNLTVQEQIESKPSNVARYLSNYDYIPDERAGKISGAEILSVIKLLTCTEEIRPDNLQVYTYKKFRCPLTEFLKVHFNHMLKNKRLYIYFNQSHYLDARHVFNVDYLIFSQILANRLSAFIPPFFRQKTGEYPPIVFSLSFETGEQKIRWSFLKEALKKLQDDPAFPPPDCNILDCILPKDQTSGKLRQLLPGCPLTNTILKLALMHLKDKLYKVEEQNEHEPGSKKIMSAATICYQRQVLFIHAQPEEHKEVKQKVRTFKEKSALKINVQLNQLTNRLPLQN